MKKIQISGLFLLLALLLLSISTSTPAPEPQTDVHKDSLIRRLREHNLQVLYRIEAKTRTYETIPDILAPR